MCLLLLLSFKDSRFLPFRVSLPLFCFILQSREISTLVYLVAYLYFPLFRFLSSSFWKFQPSYRISFISSNNFSNNNFIRLNYSCTLFVSLALLHKALLSLGGSQHFPLLGDRKFLDGKDSSLISLILRPSTYRCPINVNNMGTFIGKMFLADKNSLCGCYWIIQAQLLLFNI